ncbi:MAG: DUF503 domain-containing protein [Nitrospinae bacterium]|nr:DUF503 domain-containing protein [Nitrospinota bacterium]
MKIGICVVDLYIPNNHSLKGKRQVLKSIKDRVKNRFNVSLAELDEHDKWQRSSLGIVTISNESKQVDSVLNNVMNFIQSSYEVQVLDYRIELL